MARLFSLIRVSLKGSYALTDGKTKNSWLKKLTPLWITLALSPTLVSFGFLTRELVVLLLPMQQEGIVLGLLFSSLALLTFFFGIFLIPSIFYFSKDIESLLSYPLKAYEIVLAKLSVALVYEYTTLLLLGLPIIGGYVSVVHPPILFYVFLLLTLTLLPIVPLILSGTLIFLVMLGMPFAKNKDFFNYLSGFVALSFAIGINLTIQSFAPQFEDPNVLITLVQQGNNSLMNLYAAWIPTVRYATEAVVSLDFMSFGIYALLTLGFIGLFILLAQALYFRTVIGITETGANRKALSQRNLSKLSQSTNPIFSYALKELRLLFRTPIYLLNNVSTVIILPVILGASMFSGLGSEPEIEALLASIPWKDPNLSIWLLGIGLSIGYFMSSLNLITPTSISREGTNVWFMKIIPLSAYDQAKAKILSGLLISAFGLFSTLIPFIWFFKLTWIHALHLFLGGVLASLLMNLWGMLVDLFHPKLVWESEAVPVKQNINAAFTMVPAFGLVPLIFYIILSVQLDVMVLYGLMSILNLALIMLCAYLLKSKSESLLTNINP